MGWKYRCHSTQELLKAKSSFAWDRGFTPYIVGSGALYVFLGSLSRLTSQRHHWRQFFLLLFIFIYLFVEVRRGKKQIR